MFAKIAKDETNLTLTENGAIALRSTNSALLDLFSVCGAMRQLEQEEIEKYLLNAYDENPLLTLKLIFYTRNIRGGLGERRAFRIMLRKLATINPEAVIRNIYFIPFFGRWDDLYCLVGTEAESAAFEFIRQTIEEDVMLMKQGQPISLAAKWLKSINASSKESRELGKLTAKYLLLSEKEYRRLLSKLRAYIDVTERKMSHNDWDKIEYPKVPSIAMKNYRNAFIRHDEERFTNYLHDVEKGIEKINASTLYPYDILQAGKLREKGLSGTFYIEDDPVLEEQWKSLPNYIEGNNNVLVMADTSASMEDDNGRPLATSIGLALYFAERNSGPYKDLFLTFSREPRYVVVKGNSLKEKISSIPAIVQNTNIEKAFELVLQTALDNNLPNEELPKAIIIISDMQFDMAQDIDGNVPIMKAVEKKYAEHGYALPKIIYWQVSARSAALQASKNDGNVYLVSGNSPSTFRSVLAAVSKTPYEFMLEVLNDSTYEGITI